MFSIYSQGSLCRVDGSWVGLAIGSEYRNLESSLYEKNISKIQLIDKAVNNLSVVKSGVELPVGSEIIRIDLRRDIKRLYITVTVKLILINEPLILNYSMLDGSGDAVLFSN